METILGQECYIPVFEFTEDEFKKEIELIEKNVRHIISKGHPIILYRSVRTAEVYDTTKYFVVRGFDAKNETVGRYDKNKRFTFYLTNNERNLKHKYQVIIDMIKTGEILYKWLPGDDVEIRR